MKVQGSWWNGCTDAKKRAFYDGGIIKEYDHDKRRWLVQFDCQDDEDQLMRYNCVLKYADKDATTFFCSFNLPANPIPPPKEEVTHNNEAFYKEKLKWTKIFEDINQLTISDMTSIKYRREREELDVVILINC